MIPVYNGRATLPLSIRSLELQTFRDWEAIVVDDGSTDGLKQFLETLQDERFRFIRHNQNQGRAVARQTALDAARGQYVAYLDCDDFYHPLKLEKQVALFRHRPDLAYCSTGIGSFDSSSGLRRIRARFSIECERFGLRSRMRLSPVASMIKAEVAKNCVYNASLNLGEDTDYFKRALDGRLYGSIPDVLYYYGEYGSVTKAKILKSCIYQARASKHYWRCDKRYAAQNFAACSGKALLFLTIFAFVDTQTLLDRRGVVPTKKESVEFEQVFGLIRA